MRVLVAEDDRHTREGLADVLAAEGYTVILASDGREALKLFDRESPDFVCLDVMMPNTDGYEVCREIRKRNATVPVIFITAKSEEIDKVLGLELGADDFIVKPFSSEKVLDVIEKYQNDADPLLEDWDVLVIWNVGHQLLTATDPIL